MTERDEPQDSAAPRDPADRHTGTPADPDERRMPDRAELDRIFGDVLPETTRDERANGSHDDEGGRGGDDWYARNRPPHHGG